jgi:hypothetical protein
MDRLLETALSTSDILDDYSNPKVGEFFIAKETTPPVAKVVLTISGGVLQDLFGSGPAIAVTRVDWDTEGSDSSEPGIVEIPDGRGGTQLVAAHSTLRLVIAAIPLVCCTNSFCCIRRRQMLDARQNRHGGTAGCAEGTSSM